MTDKQEQRSVSEHTGEPVAWRDKKSGTLLHEEWLDADPLYTAPPQKKPWGTYMGHRMTPDGTKEFWGVADAPIPEGSKLYTTPQPAQKPWVGLTDDERFEVADHSDCFEDVVDAVEAKLKGKNT